MRSVKSFVAAGVASLLSSMAFAADLPIAAPYAPPVADFGGWYLRGDIGFSNQFVKNVLDTNPHAYDNVLVSQTSAFSSAGIFDIGFGYQFNNWFRTDFTAQYRGKSSFTGLDVVTGTFSFVSLGSGITGPTFSFDQVTNTTHVPFAFRNIYSNDVMIGMRWNLMSPPPYEPLITKG